PNLQCVLYSRRRMHGRPKRGLLPVAELLPPRQRVSRQRVRDDGRLFDHGRRYGLRRRRAHDDDGSDENEDLSDLRRRWRRRIGGMAMSQVWEALKGAAAYINCMKVGGDISLRQLTICKSCRSSQLNRVPLWGGATLSCGKM